jgi:ABC-type polar amino acid transport system ATPase subunit
VGCVATGMGGAHPRAHRPGQVARHEHELDKIESDEKAQRFLTDIKVVFRAFNVFYLISVSENAMSQFERRGLRFREAFGSAFDEVVAVDYFDFDTSRHMLTDRVLGLPMQFHALCHVLSGGLARELMRTARDLVERSCWMHSCWRP